ncbi:MAG: hypothetical protein WD010_07980 [Nitriliruptor sp.]|uniref:hypothetical protein n=1 Tax=Nitriliruptor sp. TaxID=2448056 RepID=UPI0034A061A9
MEIERREFRNELVRLADLTVNDDVIQGRTFENCQIIGPAVMAPLGSTSITYCTWDGTSFEAFAWPVAPERHLIGAIGALECTFFKCRFVRVGLVVPEDKLDEVRAGFTTR